MRENRFSDKVIIVTGGGTGIGEACAVAFAEENGRVVIAGRREAPLKRTVEKIESKSGRASYIQADVSKSKDVSNLVNQVVQKYGKIDVFVANASIHVLSPIIETSDEDINRLIDINVKGTYYQLREISRQMLIQGYGSIVAMSSISGLVGQRNASLYCCSKAAIINMVYSFSYELAGQNIRVNAVCPGTIGKDGMAVQLAERSGNPKEWFRKEFEKIPMRRAGDPREVAMVTLFLASDEASFVTGSYYLVDGGMTFKS